MEIVKIRMAEQVSVPEEKKSPKKEEEEDKILGKRSPPNMKKHSDVLIKDYVREEWKTP